MTYVRPFQKEGLLWLRATAAYEVLDEPIMSDVEWDALTIVLRDNYEQLDPYLRTAIPRECLESSTGSGINWSRGLPAIALEKLSGADTRRKSKV